MKTFKLIIAVAFIFFSIYSSANKGTNNEDLILKMSNDNNVKNLIIHSQQFIFIKLLSTKAGNLKPEIKSEINKFKQKIEESKIKVESYFPEYAKMTSDDKQNIITSVIVNSPFEITKWSCLASADSVLGVGTVALNLFHTWRFDACLATAVLADTIAIVVTDGADALFAEAEFELEVKACWDLFLNSTFVPTATAFGTYVGALIYCVNNYE